MSFSFNLREMLELRNMQVKELATRTDISKNTLDNYLSGQKSIPNAENAVKIARVLGVSVEYLVTGSAAAQGAGGPVPPRLRKICEDLEEFDETDFKAVCALIDVLKTRYSPRKLGKRAFAQRLGELLSEASEKGLRCVDVNAGDLHRLLGGYPGSDHRMPACCQAMLAAMGAGDEITQSPPSGTGASLTIRYALPR